MLWTLNRHVKIFLHKSWAIFLQLPHRNFATFLSKLPLPLGKSWLHAWHLIFPWNCFPKKHLLFSQNCFPTNNLLKKIFSIFFKCLFPTFRFCFSLVAKLNLTHKKHFKFCFRPYFALFIYMVFVPVITNKIALVWILIYVCCFGISITNCSEDIWFYQTESSWEIFSELALQSTQSIMTPKEDCEVSVNFHGN